MRRIWWIWWSARWLLLKVSDSKELGFCRSAHHQFRLMSRDLFPGGRGRYSAPGTSHPDVPQVPGAEYRPRPPGRPRPRDEEWFISTRGRRWNGDRIGAKRDDARREALTSQWVGARKPPRPIGWVSRLIPEIGIFSRVAGVGTPPPESGWHRDVRFRGRSTDPGHPGTSGESPGSSATPPIGRRGRGGRIAAGTSTRGLGSVSRRRVAPRVEDRAPGPAQART